MIEKIQKELKTKYKDLGLSENVLKVIATKLSKTVNNESEIEQAVAGVEDEMKVYQIFSDQNRTLKHELEKALKKEETKRQEPNQEPKQEPEQEKEETIPQWAKALIDANKDLANKINHFEEQKTHQSNEAKLLSKLNELGVNENFYKLQIAGKTFQDENEIEAFAISVKEAEDSFMQKISNEKLKTQEPPRFGEGVKEGEVSPEAQAFIKAKFNQNEEN